MKLIFVYLAFSLVTIHFSFVVSQDAKDLPLIPSSKDRDGLDRGPDSTTESEPSLSSDLNKNGDELPSILNTNKNDDDVNVNKSKLGVSNNVNVEEAELPQLFQDFDSSVDNRPNNNSQYQNSVPQRDDKQYEKTTASIKDYTDKSDLFDQDDTEADYTEDSKEDRDLDKEEDTTDMFGEFEDDDGDDKYYVSNNWKQYEDDDNDKDWNGDKDNIDDDDFESQSDYSQSENTDDELVKKTKQPTAPTSMVLFYTWMIVAVLIIIVGISTYQSRCKGIRIPGLKAASNAKDDKKRLMENEFV